MPVGELMYQFGGWQKENVLEGGGHARSMPKRFPRCRRVVVAPIDKYDIILGKPWLHKHNPRINFRTNHVNFIDSNVYINGDNRVTGDPKPPVNACARSPEVSVDSEDMSEFFFMRAKEARKAIRKGADWYMVRLQESDSDRREVELNLLDANPNIGVTGQKRDELMNMLKNHHEVLTKELPTRLPPYRRVNHEIDVEPGCVPPSRPPFRLSQPELDELHRQLKEMLQRGFIRPSKSPYGAPVFFVRKSDGTLRMVCDWRQLNKLSVKTQACLPSIEDLFDSVRGARYFTKLDLKSGYNQVRVEERDIPKTAINTPFGHYEFTVMGFGLTNAPATFMALMNDVLRPFLRAFVVVFLDDILIYSRSWSDHLEHIDAVLTALRNQSLFCNAIKCEFALDSIRFLGHFVDGTHLWPDPEKINVVRNWSAPTSVTGIRQFLGFTNYFRRFTEGYSFIARPLEELTGKNKRFCWNEECQSAFEALKEALISAPVLRLPDVGKPFRLVTDASDTALAGVLLQKDEAEDWHPVAYTSRRLRVEERNYHANERETLAVIHALRVWKIYLFKPFELVTDNRAVTYLLSKKQLSGREARWLDLLAEFDMTISHKPGRENIADPISRALQSAPSQVMDDDSGNSATLGSVIGEFCQDEDG